jgi:hypothetical protein
MALIKALEAILEALMEETRRALDRLLGHRGMEGAGGQERAGGKGVGAVIFI